MNWDINSEMEDGGKKMGKKKDSRMHMWMDGMDRKKKR